MYWILGIVLVLMVAALIWLIDAIAHAPICDDESQCF
jgi:hypothetical protein